MRNDTSKELCFKSTIKSRVSIIGRIIFWQVLIVDGSDLGRVRRKIRLIKSATHKRRTETSNICHVGACNSKINVQRT
jgi:hypothetical protein